ncbi:MAG: hydroxymethylglutaryl-CoA reductase, degradative [Elusimicrobia bacterium]|nr:hydroxymethylglutaryl-CoA reductase, degradative [Elusimicrobiota bacterium]
MDKQQKAKIEPPAGAKDAGKEKAKAELLSSEVGRTSRLPGFYKLDIWERLDKLDEWLPLPLKEKWILRSETLTAEQADTLIENVIGVFGMPLGLAVNFRINDKDYLIPMAVEETSIVAACSHMAKLIRENGSLVATAEHAIMEGQIQIVDVPDLDRAEADILAAKDRLLKLANKQDQMLASLGGGAKDFVLKRVPTESGTMLVCHLQVDAVDAMGANAVNTMVETLGPIVGEMAKGEVVCKIITNLCDKSLVRARFDVQVDCLAKEGFTGAKVAERIVKAFHWADADPYRATTHNKGIMNGIDAVLVATGNDWRAVEAGCHAFAARTGRYRSLTRYRLEGDRLKGEIEVPIAVGVVGGVTKLHPGVSILLKILGMPSRRELAEVIASVGLVQNLAAVRALVTEGIQEGHMTLHARNVAYSAGAWGDLAIHIADQMVTEGRIRFDRARELLKKMVAQKGEPPKGGPED